jgi:hypothetical protein
MKKIASKKEEPEKCQSPRSTGGHKLQVVDTSRIMIAGPIQTLTVFYCKNCNTYFGEDLKK